MLYLGIDPGSINCGYGVIKIEAKKIVAVNYDTIKLKSKDSLNIRIEIIYNEISDILQSIKPNKVAVETIFYGKNMKTAFTLGHVRGAILLAIAQHKLPFFEFSPREVKRAVTGNGNASKQQLQYMLPKILGLKVANIPEDAADALAVAFCMFNQDRFVY